MTTTASLVAREVGYARRSLLRDPQGVFFTVGLPLLYLLIFCTVFGHQVGRVAGQPGRLHIPVILTASVMVIGVVSAAFQNLAVTLVQDRESGVLKRLHSAPVPLWVFLAGHLVNAVLTALTLALGVLTLGVLLYGVPVPDARRLVALVVVTLVGTCACAGAAIPFTRLVRSGTAAVPMTFAVTLTLFFISGNFFPGASLPRGLQLVADVFPVRHFFTATLTTLNPHQTGWGFAWSDLGVLALWAVGGAAAGLVSFSWLPQRDR